MSASNPAEMLANAILSGEQRERGDIERETG